MHFWVLYHEGKGVNVSAQFCVKLCILVVLLFTLAQGKFKMFQYRRLV